MASTMAQPQPTDPTLADLTPEEWLEILPREADLPSEETKMESSLHALQMRLLVTTLEWHWRDREDFFIGDNLTIYFSYQQTKTHDFRGPDFFLVTGTERRHRKSWVIWEEGKLPELIIELLSDSTAAADRGIKKDIYERRFHTPEYFWFAPDTGEFKGFRLNGIQYEEIEPEEHGWRWSEVLGLFLGIHEGLLKYFTPAGELLPTPEEVAQQATQRAEAEAQRAEKLAAKLRELGFDPNQL
jgi:Uma2 family endonuclease